MACGGGITFCGCGCGQAVRPGKRFIERHNLRKHGHAPTGKPTSEYRTYQSMLWRCSPLNKKARKRYFDRGIDVCEQWRGEYGFMNFLCDLGMKPSGMQLDRIDNDRGYEADNCRWATPKQQRANQESPETLRTHCPRGHPYSGDNLKYYTHPNGRFTQRVCKQCHREREREARRWQAKKGESLCPAVVV